MNLEVKLFIWLVFFTVSDHSLSATKLQIYTEHFPPYNFIADDKVIGINAEIVNTLCENTNIQCEFVFYSWQRSFKSALQDKTGGLVSTSRTDEREKRFQWVGPLVNGTVCAYKLRENSFTVDSLEDFLKYTVAISGKDVYQNVLERMGFVVGKNLLIFSDWHEEARVLQKGKVDFILASQFTLSEKLKSVSLSATSIEPLYRLSEDGERGNHLALNLEVPASVVAQLNRELIALRKQGIIRSVTNRYLQSYTANLGLTAEDKTCDKNTPFMGLSSP